MALQRTVKGTFDKGPDIEGRVSEIEVEGERLVEIADFIVSRQEYGRGYHFPLSQLGRVYSALSQVGLGSSV